MVSEAVAHQPAAVSQLLLQALFMQISEVSLSLTWPHRLCLFRALLGVTATVTRFPLSKHTGGGGATPAFSGQLVFLQFMWGVSLPPSIEAFLTQPLLQAFPLQGCWVGATSPAFSSRLVYSQFHEGLPHPFSAQGTPPSLLPAFFCSFVYYSVWFFSLFPGWGLVCPGDYADLAQGCLWEYRMLLSSPGGLRLPKQLGAGVWWRGSPPGFSV
jgi:hypothetical protein